MKKTYISIAIMLIMAIVSAPAQNKRKPVNEKVHTAKTEKQIDQRIDQMVSATQDIVFIDSIVVDKNVFLTKYNLNQESGHIYKYNDFFKTDEQPNTYVYVNELGNKCYYSIEGKGGDIKLYTSDLMDGTWTNASELQGIDYTNYEMLNYPFMMADGTTLYFSATGKESIGRADIFVTRFDSESGKFLKPENIGMPFNSTANDYMYAIDEIDSIGWFATDRNQSEGKVCIYIFIPSDTRHTYSPDKYTKEQMHSLARLESIVATWGDGKARTAALARLASITSSKTKHEKRDELTFVVNDKTTYTKFNDFKSATNRNKFKQLQSLRRNLSTLGKTLNKARNYYSTANAQDRKTLKDEILKSEQKYDSLELQIKQKEKELRNSENSLLK